MGKWQLEVFRMALYVFTPVAAFYLFHQVEYFESSIERYQRKMNSKAAIENQQFLKEVFEALNKEREKKFEKELEKLKQNESQ